MPRGVSVYKVNRCGESKICKRIEHGKISWVEAYITQEVDHPYLNHGEIRMFGDAICIYQEPALGDLTRFFDRPLDQFVDVVRGVAALHQLGFIHGDVKAPNVLVFEDHLRVSDFGHCLKMEWNHPMFWGTPWRRAPEMEREGWGPEVDVWGLGAILFRWSTGREPWEKGQRDDFCARYPESVHEENAHPLCELLLHPDPQKRMTLQQLCRYFDIPYTSYYDTFDFETHLLTLTSGYTNQRAVRKICRDVADLYAHRGSHLPSQRPNHADFMYKLLPQLSL